MFGDLLHIDIVSDVAKIDSEMIVAATCTKD